MANPQWMYFSRALYSSLNEENSYHRLSLSTCPALILEGGIGIFGFAVLAIFWIGFSVFGPKGYGFSVLVFIAVCGFFVF